MNNIFYLLLPLSGLITAISQIMLKISADKKHDTSIREYLNAYVIGSYVLFTLVILLNIFTYTKIDYKYTVIINATATIFILIFSHIFLNEKITRMKILGNTLIVLGMAIFFLL